MNATKVPYDLTNVTSVDNIFEFVQEVNILSGEWFMTGMLFAGFVIMFTAMKQGDNNKEALMGTSFMIAVLAIFFRMMDFISTTKLVIFMIVFALIFSITIFKKD